MPMCFVVSKVDRHNEEKVLAVYSSRPAATDAAQKIRAAYKERGVGGWKITLQSYPFNPDPETI